MPAACWPAIYSSRPGIANGLPGGSASGFGDGAISADLARMGKRSSARNPASRWVCDQVSAFGLVGKVARSPRVSLSRLLNQIPPAINAAPDMPSAMVRLRMMFPVLCKRPECDLDRY